MFFLLVSSEGADELLNKNEYAKFKTFKNIAEK